MSMTIRPVGYDPETEPLPTRSSFICPECPESFKSAEELSPHMERHREVNPPTTDPRTGEVTSRACEKKCGRNFLRPSEYREHTSICDGQPPILKPRPKSHASQIEQEALRNLTKDSDVRVLDMSVIERRRKRRVIQMAAKLMKNCDSCPATFKDGRGLFQHKKKCGKTPAGAGSAKVRGKSAAVSTIQGSNVIQASAKLLRDEALALRNRAEKLDEMARSLEEIDG